MRLTCLALFLLLAGCMSGQKAPEVKGNPITGDSIAVTSLDAPAPGAGGAKPAPAKPATSAPTAGATAPAADAPLSPLSSRPTAAAPDGKTPATAAAETPAAEAPLPPPSSPEELACRKSGGTWSNAVGKLLKACVHVTKDAGKSCTKAGQCEGLCLARSGTCAPIKPLFGCNDIFQDDGGRVTLCID